jgi:hypothetical protein
MEEGNNRAAYGQILIQEASACRIFIQLANAHESKSVCRLPLPKLICQLKARNEQPGKRTAKRRVQAAGKE